MPNLPAHIDLARQAAELLGHSVLEAHLGSYLLGCTAPDVRALTRGTREQYHFATLEFRSVGDGIDGLFEAHPELKSLAVVNGPTKAFMAGYITHLVLDESWIMEFFRPYFGNQEVYEDEVIGLVLDRALQLELDRLSFGDVRMDPLLNPPPAGEEVGPLPPPGEVRGSALIAQANGHVEVPFLPYGTLIEWRDFVLETVGRGFSWDRLRFMARRISRGDEAHSAHRVADEFLDGMLASLDAMFEHVSRDDLSDFRSRAVEQMAQVVGDYLE